MPEPVEGNEFGSDLVQRPQFGANRPSALGIGAASFASGSGTRFGIWELGIGDGNGARSLSLSKCRAHILSERGKNKKRAKI